MNSGDRWHADDPACDADVSVRSGGCGALGVRLAVFASIDLSGLFPDAIAEVLEKAGVDLQTSFDAGIRILSNSKGGVTFAYEFDGDIHEHHFECFDGSS